jgi:hypothetical protein
MAVTPRPVEQQRGEFVFVWSADSLHREGRTGRVSFTGWDVATRP